MTMYDTNLVMRWVIVQNGGHERQNESEAQEVNHERHEDEGKRDHGFLRNVVMQMTISKQDEGEYSGELYE